MAAESISQLFLKEKRAQHVEGGRNEMKLDEKENVIISPSLLLAAQKAAVNMIASGLSLQKIAFGRNNSFFWLARDSSMLIGPLEIEVNNCKFYIGSFKS